MKKISIIMAFVFSVLVINAQKVKVDDGTVTLDKVPIAKVEGSSGLFKNTDLTYKFLNDQPMLRLTVQSSGYFIPTHKDLYWYEIQFFKPSKTVRVLIKGGAYNSQKKLSEMLFVTYTPQFLKNNEIDTVALSQFAEKNDGSKKIMEDTAVYNAYEIELRKALNNGRIDRDLIKPIILKSTGNEVVAWITTSTFDIIQDNVVIGSVEKRIENGNSGLSGNYKIFKRFKNSETIGGKPVQYGIASCVEIGSFPFFRTVQDKKEHKLDSKFSDKSENQIVQFLVSNGYL